jgi:hypothetical protein
LSPPPAPEEAGICGSRLRYASQAAPQQLAAVKLHRVFSPHWGFVDCSPTLCGFTGLRAGTAGPSLIHSCTSELTRQGIWLPISRGLATNWKVPVKRVRVTPGVDRPLSRLYPGFRYRCWPGLRSRSKPFGLAAPYVFIKQSGPPCHCDLPTHPHRAGRQAPLLPRLRG